MGSGLSDFDGSESLRGGTDGTLIGNVSDALKIYASGGSPSTPVTSSGSLTTLNSDVVFDNSAGYSTISFVITGTWVGTITPAVSVDNSNFLSWECADRATFYTSMTANGTFTADISSHRYFRLRMTSYTSGTASVSYFVTDGAGPNKRIVLNTQTFSSSGATQRSQVASIETEHDKIHLGLMFMSFSNAVLAAAAYHRVAFTTGAQVEHFILSVMIEYQATITIYEGSTTTKGTTITEYNRNRGSANTPLTTVQNVSAVTAAGTAIFGPLTFGSSGGNGSAVILGRAQEIDLKTSTEYMIEVQSLQNNNSVSIMYDHYRNQA
jgi:hypothetical protein